jgi:ketosteroid isomerase-like protein
MPQQSTGSSAVMNGRAAIRWFSQTREEVQSFLDRMARAVTMGDGRTISEMWETPAVVLGDRQVMAVSSAREVEQFFSGAKEQYNARGITDTRPEIIRLDWPTDRIAFVTVLWPYLDASGAAHGSETSTYTLRRDDDGQLKIRVAVMHGAKKT